MPPPHPGANMRRREFLGVLGSAAAAWPVAARGQQPSMPPVVGFLGSTEPNEPRHAAFRRGLAEQGFAEGRNISIEYLFAHSQYDRLPSLVANFRRLEVPVIFASGNQAALATKAANVACPVVFAIGDDPVRLKLVASLNKPDSDITGVTFYSVALIGKRLGLLHDLIPQAAMIAMISNPASPNYQEQIAEVLAAARRLGRRIEHFDAKTPEELDKALAAIVVHQAGGLLYATDPFFNAQRKRLVDFSSQHRLPGIFSGREYMEVGASISYGANMFDAYREAGHYVGRILKGEKAGDLPVTQPTKLELILNLKAAKAMGITFPTTILALADEVIE